MSEDAAEVIRLLRVLLVKLDDIAADMKGLKKTFQSSAVGMPTSEHLENLEDIVESKS
ncbi:MAG: hypothetical protein ABJB34_02675 [Acidobacteriota bacterium]